MGVKPTTIKLSDEDLNRLLELYKNARETPVMALSTADALAGRDFASLAWHEVREFQQELGTKYGYDWTKHAVKGTGEVMEIT